MKLHKLFPTGFCFGVQRSYDEALKIAQNNKDVKVYMVGWLVHNQVVISRLEEHGITILDDTNKSRWDVINELPQTNNKDILIFSAHGTRYDAIDLAKQKGYEVYDLTCPYVYKTHKLIQNKLSKGYDVYFIGKQNHPETNAIMAIDDNIHLLDITQPVKLNSANNHKSFCTNQTTLSIKETKDYYDALKKSNNNIEIANDICDATTQRQNAIYNMPNEVDVCFVIGDPKSSNANELLQIASAKCSSYLITSKEDITSSMLSNKHCAAIIGAASCPNDLIEDVALYIDRK